jgi:hypothetical protein
MFRLTYIDAQLRQQELLREAARRRLLDSLKPRQPGIWRFPRMLGLRFATDRTAV